MDLLPPNHYFLFTYLFIIFLSNESLLLVAVVAQVFKKPHIEKGEGSDKDNEEVDNSKLNPTSEFLRYIYRYIDVRKKKTLSTYIYKCSYAAVFSGESMYYSQCNLSKCWVIIKLY